MNDYLEKMMKIQNKRIWIPVLAASLFGLTTTTVLAEGRGCGQKGQQLPVQGMGCQHQQAAGDYTGGQGCAYKGGQHKSQGMGCRHKHAQGDYTGGQGCAYKGGQSRKMNQTGMKSGNRGAGMDPAVKIKRMTMRLNLNEDQQAKIGEIMKNSREVHDAIHSKMAENRVALREAMVSGDIAQVRTLADQKGDLIAGRIVLKAEKRAQIRALLTPEQQELFDQMKGRKMHRH